jgi:hypothetical protein
MKVPISAEVQNGAFEGALHEECTSAFPFIGNAPCSAQNTPEIVHERKPIRILLSEAASKHLEGTGETCFRIIAADMSNEHPGRFVIHLAPCSLGVARQAEGVLLGTHRAVKIKAREDPSKRHSGTCTPCPLPTQAPPLEDSL